MAHEAPLHGCYHCHHRPRLQLPTTWPSAAKPEIKAKAKGRPGEWRTSTSQSPRPRFHRLVWQRSAKKMLLSILNHSYFDLVPSMTEEEVRQMRQDMIDNMDAYVIESQEDIQRAMETSRRTAEVFGSRNLQVPYFPHQHGGGRGGLRLGVSRRLKSNMKKAVQTLQAENMIYQALPAVNQRPPPCIDVFEIFGGSAKFTLRCRKFGLNALEPIDIQHGDQRDLEGRAGQGLHQEGHQTVQALVGDTWSRLSILEPVPHQHELYSQRPERLQHLQDGRKNVGPVCM